MDPPEVSTTRQNWYGTAFLPARLRRVRQYQQPVISSYFLGGPAENHGEIRRLNDWLDDGGKRYNFATGMWCDDDLTRCEDRESVAQGKIGIE